jgi:carbamoyl-phosphate synthase small subunit
MTKASLVLEDGSVFHGHSFGLPQCVAGEVVFNTGMVGYPEALTDPSYKGQILVLTYPLIGNYGVPDGGVEGGLPAGFQSEGVQIAGLVVAEVSTRYSHWNAALSLARWLVQSGVPAITGIDTRAVTKCLRTKGSLLGKVVLDDQNVEFYNPNLENLVAMVSVRSPVVYPAEGKKRVVLIDCGCKSGIIRSLLQRQVTVMRVPWDYDLMNEACDGVVISNGPGDPKTCSATISNVQRAMDNGLPVFGICLGHQILALACGADTYKMKFGHRSQNQPCVETGTKRCYVTSQNHGYAVQADSIPEGWVSWFHNANDGTNEGIRHVRKPFMSVQFHPEAAPGPDDTNLLFDEFLRML